MEFVCWQKLFGVKMTGRWGEKETFVGCHFQSRFLAQGATFVAANTPATDERASIVIYKRSL